ncbi:exonuclease SbcCD subunit D [Pelagicoccus sp. SDUM812003]|uniref:exonuclease SbcCD subunit D n=1 Tax=Pelagicoccus sp. SDUM812003 TaxID=3041267 RepID=UPI00280C7ADF|nr:exonuclease SbcCD subunit D [Pelagicoccus sp. SDUM812003]MDQ8204620.1 exonuclease SbcCD subunit D [Pelagicoccus sp. SDUM812003]
MKFLHTADWHLGRIFHQIHLTDDQSAVLDRIVEIAKAENVAAVIVAGDLYDRAVPPPEAVALLDRTWQRIISEVNVPIIAIPGNHDSATRVGYGSTLLQKAGLHIVADFERALTPITLGDVDIFALPFAEPAEVRAWSGDLTVRDHASAVACCIERMRDRFSPDRARVLVAHAFVAGARTESDSERPLSVGGAGTVPVDVFQDFHYTALGHLHAAQSVSERCLYAGSPMKYSFSEADHVKSVTIVDIDDAGSVSTKHIPMTARRDVRTIEGELGQLIAAAPDDGQRADYLRVVLTDQGALLNAIGRLREAYPNVLQLERRFLTREASAVSNVAKRQQATESELFSSFFSEVLEREPSTLETALFEETLEELRREDAERQEVSS